MAQFDVALALGAYGAAREIGTSDDQEAFGKDLGDIAVRVKTAPMKAKPQER